jgi:acyl-CoA thioester hydrolase
VRAYQHRVRYHEADAQGIVFNSRYLEFCDVACTEYLRALGWTIDALGGNGVDLVLVKAQIEFLSPARFDDLLDVDVAAERLGNSSLDLRFRITREGSPIAGALITYVNVADGGSRPLPEWFRAQLATR